MNPYLSLRSRLTLLICGLIIGVIAICVTAAYREVRRSAILGAGQRLESVAAQLGEIFATSTGRLRDRTKRLAEDPVIRSALRNPTLESLDQALATIRGSARPASTAITELWNAGGRRLLVTREVLPQGEAFAPENMAVLAQSDQVAVGSIQAGKDGLMFPVIAKVTEGGALLGYLVNLLRLEESSQQVGKLIEYHERNATVSLLSLEESSQQLSRLIGDDARFYLGNTQGDLWTDLKAQVPPPPVDVRQRHGLVEYDRQQDGARLAALAPVANTPWMLMVEFPRVLVLERANAMLWRLGLFVGLLLIVGAASAWLLSGNFTRPLAELADAAEAISAGEYSRQVALTRKDELGAVGRAFNHMAESINEKLRELRASEERLQQVVASSGAVIYQLRVAEDAVKLEWISENVTRILGYEITEASAPGWWLENLHSEDRERIMRMSAAYLSTDTIREYRFRHKDGSYRWIRDEVRILPRSAGTSTEFVGAMMDTTGQHQLEEQFRQAQKMEAIGRLAGGVAHDFNNLLAIITGYGELLLGRLGPEDPNREEVEEIQTAADRAAALTRQLLAFSRKQVLEPRIIDLNSVVTGLIRMLPRLLGEDIKVNTKLNPGLGHVLIDTGQMEQVIMNLVVNARDAMPKGGALTIESQNIELTDEYAHRHVGVTPGDYVMLAISDTGIGMDAETVQRIFEPFFTTKKEGTGLGLATVYGIVKQSGGNIWVYSEPEHGTTFKIYLPRVDQPAEPAELSAEEIETPSGVETILLVEDEEKLKRLIRKFLESIGYTVLEATNGADALRVANEHQGAIDLLLTDVVMPETSGRDLANKLLSIRPEIKTLFMSGYTDDAIAHHGVLDPGTHLIVKPFNRKALARKLREVLAK